MNNLSQKRNSNVKHMSQKKAIPTRLSLMESFEIWDGVGKKGQTNRKCEVLFLRKCYIWNVALYLIKVYFNFTNMIL